MGSKKIVIVGGVAGGASAAARARRLSEDSEIILFERGPHVSFANCGLPYYIGREIAEERDLYVQTPQGLKNRFNLDVRVRTEVIEIDRDAKEVEARNLDTGATYKTSYDALILSPGASPLKPPIPGIDRPGHFVIRNVPDTLALDAWLSSKPVKNAVIVGGGYIGLEMAEQLHRRGIHVSIAEVLPQVMNSIDMDMAVWLHEELALNGVDLYLGDGVASFAEPDDGEYALASVVILKSRKRLPADVVILGLGVRPEADLAKKAGLEIGKLGGIRVNEKLQTSDPNIWAVGDVIEVRHAVTGEWCHIPLAGPANRQGRMAADIILGKDVKYEGTWGTGILRLFNITSGGTGANEKMLEKAGISYQTVFLHPLNHAGYYPGATRLTLKVLFSPETGKLLGAQVVGENGVDKRIDVLATALKAGMTMDELAQVELSYAPPFGSAKDPVNLAGMIAENVMAGDISLVQWHEVEDYDPDKILLLDVRQPEERSKGYIPGSINIPLPELRHHLNELPKDKEIVAYCLVGQRSYYACRILLQNGFRARNLTGAFLTYAKATGDNKEE